MKKFIDSLISILNSWGKFLEVIFNPYTLTFVGSTFLLLFYSINNKDDSSLSNTLAILGSITGGLAGAVIKEKYDSLFKEDALTKKGRSAFRNLQSISIHLFKVRQWIEDFEKEIKKKEIKNSFREVDRHIETIRFNTQSGLEDWIDMIPELQTQYDTLKKFEETYQSHISALLEAKQELLAVKENEADKRAIIEKKIGVLESSIKDLKREKQEITGITGPISLGINTGLRNSSVVAGITGCNKCGRLFSYSPASVSVLGSTLCPDCSRNI